MENETRLFFVVEFENGNPEIFETLEEAKEYREVSYTHTGEPSVIRIAIVKNAFKDFLADKITFRWNYEDLSDTFEYIKTL